jgi:hypothetical protein
MKKECAFAIAISLGIACHAKREQSGSTPVPMPAECDQVLANIDCWLRSANNAPERVTQFVVGLRESFESERRESGEVELRSRCASIERLHVATFTAAGCATAPPLPASAPMRRKPEACEKGAFFFVRKDAKIVGCHLECSVPADCPPPQKCSGLGSAIGGPLDQPFCE